MFIVRLKTYLEKWMKLSETPQTYDGLRDGALIEAYSHRCPWASVGSTGLYSGQDLPVIVNNRVKGRTIPKKINVRVEHIKHSNSAGRGRC